MLMTKKTLTLTFGLVKVTGQGNRPRSNPDNCHMTSYVTVRLRSRSNFPIMCTLSNWLCNLTHTHSVIFGTKAQPYKALSMTQVTVTLTCIGSNSITSFITAFHNSFWRCPLVFDISCMIYKNSIVKLTRKLLQLLD